MQFGAKIQTNLLANQYFVFDTHFIEHVLSSSFPCKLFSNHYHYYFLSLPPETLPVMITSNVSFKF